MQRIISIVNDTILVSIDYKAPHALRGTPARHQKPKSSYKKFKLFKGHRP